MRVGIGGWDFAPWRGTFYPSGLPKRQELEYASRHLTSIEINATFYRTQSPESFRNWRDTAPDGFAFAVKAPQFATHRRELAEAGPSIERFLAGVVELGPKLGPILWQFPHTRRFDEATIESFLALLPQEWQGVRLRHAIEARHASFADPGAVRLMRRYGVALAIVDSTKHRLFGDITADFAYLRLQRNDEAEPEGYASMALDGWAARLDRWSAGETTDDLELADPEHRSVPGPLPCFVDFISGDKVRAPTAAGALLRRLGWEIANEAQS